MNSAPKTTPPSSITLSANIVNIPPEELSPEHSEELEPIEKENTETPKEEENKKEESTGATVWIANPASTYCVEQEWKIEIREDAEWAQYGVCKFKDGTEVEEWEYFRANHKDERSTWAVAETWTVAETTTGAVVENATGAVATTWAAENN